MIRAAVILTSNELNPFYGIVTFDDTVDDGQSITPMEVKLDKAVKAHVRENWDSEALEGDSPEGWFEDVLGDYTYFYITNEIAKKLTAVPIPVVDVEHLNNSDEVARSLLEQLMISICEKFAYTSRFSRLE